MSTEGPSGPREAPLPSVMAAANALSTGDAAPRSRACSTQLCFTGQLCTQPDREWCEINGRRQRPQHW